MLHIVFDCLLHLSEFMEVYVRDTVQRRAFKNTYVKSMSRTRIFRTRVFYGTFQEQVFHGCTLEGRLITDARSKETIQGHAIRGRAFETNTSQGRAFQRHHCMGVHF